MSSGPVQERHFRNPPVSNSYLEFYSPTPPLPTEILSQLNSRNNKRTLIPNEKVKSPQDCKFATHVNRWWLCRLYRKPASADLQFCLLFIRNFQSRSRKKKKIRLLPPRTAFQTEPWGGAKTVISRTVHESNFLREISTVLIGLFI